MRSLISFIICGLFLVSCLSSDQKIVDAHVFDLAGFVSELKSAKVLYKNVKLISDNGEVHDTVEYANFSIDTILPLILSFDFSKKERGSEFSISKSIKDEMPCTQYKLVGASDIEHLTVCKNKDEVMRISGKKKNNSLLGFLQQSYQMDIANGFTLNSTYIDKVSKDTLHTASALHWNVIIQ